MGYNERWRLNARDWEEMSKDELQEQISDTASNIFFEFMLEIEDTKLYDEYIIPTKEGTESTEKASELFYRIEEHIENLYE